MNVPTPAPRTSLDRSRARRSPAFAAIAPALVALGAGFGCSHAQQPTAPVARTALVDVPARRAPAAVPPPAPPAPAAASMDDGRTTNKGLAVYFDFDSALLRDDARPVLQKVASIARAHDATVRIEGNCDEVGTIEYNLALGEHRAVQAKEYLSHLGVTPAKIQTVSYGSQRPKVDGHDENAHAQNRRDDLIVR